MPTEVDLAQAMGVVMLGVALLRVLSWVLR